MSSIPIDLPKRVTGEALEQACMKAARNMGYKAKSVDEFRTRYSLGSVHRHNDYAGTNVRIGNLIPAFHVRGIEKGKEQDRFFIWTGFPSGFASNKRVQEYLSTFSRYLS